MGFLAIYAAILVTLSSAPTQGTKLSIAKPNCEDHCGDVTIPFPFGTTPGCYLDDAFFINCNTSFPKNVQRVDLRLSSYDNYSKVLEFNDCGFAFVAKKGAFTFSPDSFANLKNMDKLPVVIDWDVGNVTSCDEANKDLAGYACASANSECVKPDNGDGYRCSCQKGYQGNPYLDQGCQDVDECQDPDNECEEGRCRNTLGSYECFCPVGHTGDGKRDGKGCVPGESLVIRIVAACWLYLDMKRRRHMKMRRHYFLQNGGQLLQEKLHGRQSSSNSVRIFSATDLQKATNSFHQDMIIGQGGHGTVYKGVLPDDNSIVAIKRSKIVDTSEIDQFINEVIVLSQINHRNVVKLLGCCLETEAPLLVYEYICNGTLYEHLHQKHYLSWDVRLRIAAETAGVLSYLHSAASVPIIHRDVKTANILLDNTMTAKVSDFGASRLVPLDQTQLSTLVQGTFGYLDPEYMQTQQLTEKSDVYSFGVVLVELLAGKKAVRRDGPKEERSLANFFLKVMNEGRVFQVVEESVMRGGDEEVVMRVGDVAKRCVNVKGEERPLMKEVAMELEGLLQLIMGEKHSWI